MICMTISSTQYWFVIIFFISLQRVVTKRYCMVYESQRLRQTEHLGVSGYCLERIMYVSILKFWIKALSTQLPNTVFCLSRPVECNFISYPIIQKSQQSVEGRLFYKNVMSVFALQIKLIMNWKSSDLITQVVSKCIGQQQGSRDGLEYTQDGQVEDGIQDDGCRQCVWTQTGSKSEETEEKSRLITLSAYRCTGACSITVIERFVLWYVSMNLPKFCGILCKLLLLISTSCTLYWSTLVWWFKLASVVSLPDLTVHMPSICSW